MIHTDSKNPAFRFEGLLREAFHCTKGQDPFGYAMQEVFDHNFVESITQRGRRALSTAFIKLIFDHSDHQEKFIELDNRVWKATTQEEIINIIDEGIGILKEIKSE